MKYLGLLLFAIACTIKECVTVEDFCNQKEVSMSYLDVALDMIGKVKEEYPSCDSCRSDLTVKTLDCADLYLMGYRDSGVYKISPMNRLTMDSLIDVYCDMKTDGGGWTVIQRRGDYKRPKDYFYKDWKSYKEGFGDIEKDFWLGNDNIFALTNQKLYTIRFDMTDVDNVTKYAQYDVFWIDDENHKYTSHIADYSGNAGDSMLKEHNNKKFSTKDQDNDNQTNEHCAGKYKGGWWYDACHQANPNGQYHKGRHESFADGVNWFTWKGYHESLLTMEMKIRPRNVRQSLLDFAVTSLNDK